MRKEEIIRYEKRLNKLYAKGDFDSLYDEQYAFGAKLLAEMENRLDGSVERKIVYDLFHHVIYTSESGNAIVDVSDYQSDLGGKSQQEVALIVSEIILNEYLNFLLEGPIIENRDGCWSIDILVGGYFVPEWDGWTDGTIESYYNVAV